MMHTWESIVLQDESLRRDALLVCQALARLANDECRVTISMRSLGDAMLGTKFSPGIGKLEDGMSWQMAASRGLYALTNAHYVRRLNPDASRREPGEYVLTLPAMALLGA